MPVYPLIQPKCLIKKAFLSAIILMSFTIASAQNGTYQKKAGGGAYGVISVQKIGVKLKAEVFTWWNSANAQTGYYSGEGTLKNNSAVLHSTENEPGCKVTLSIIEGTIKALFNNCGTDHLTDDFNGVYTKITDAIAGDYVVIVPTAYFYKNPAANSKLKTYVLKGDKVRLDMDRIAASRQNWLFCYFTSKAGKETAGYIQMADLKRVE